MSKRGNGVSRVDVFMILMAIIVPIVLGLLTVWIIPIVQDFVSRHHAADTIKTQDDNHL